jgi:glucose/arabinose dehydrogenase
MPVWASVVVVAVLLWAGSASSASAVTLPSGFAEKTVFSGLTQPTAVRFASDGRVFVAEKSGLIKEFDNLADTTPRVYADLRPKVHDYWDRGLLSIALDPSFPTRSLIYALYAHDAPIGENAPTYGDVCADPTRGGCKISGRLSKILPDGSEQVLVEDWCQQYPSHSTGSVNFGPDGMLYASGGDGASFNWVDFGQGGATINRCVDPLNEGGALRSQDLRTTTDPVSLDGSIIRVNPDTGEGAAGNPFSASPDANARRIIAYGLRNPFRTTFRPGTSELWAGDVGWSEWEEINRVTNAGDATAENFGWPCYEGAARQPGYDGQNLPVCETLYGANAVTPPYYAYRHSDHVIPSESCPIGGSSIAGLSFAFYGGGPYPAEYDGALFFADYTRRCIWAMAKGGTVLPSPSNIKSFVGGAANPVDLQMGPDGNLYYADIGGGTIRRIEYTAGVNQPPVAVASASPLTGPVGMEVAFDGTRSSDPNGDTLTYAWDLDGDGTLTDSTSATPRKVYAAAGSYRVTLRVTDSKGASATDTVTIGVGQPTVTIQSPTAATQWAVGEVVSFTGSAVDNQNVAIPPERLEWNLVLKHGPCTNASDCHDHPVQDLPRGTSGTFTAPDHEFPSKLALSLKATDANGVSATQTVILSPKTVTLSFRTNPAGLNVTVGGTTATAPFSRTIIQNGGVSFSVPSPQNQKGRLYFQEWSDGTKRLTGNAQQLTATTSTTYTATFSKR